MAQNNYVIIGGSKGIGLALVNKLLNNGHHVTVLSRNEDQIPGNERLRFIQADLTTNQIAGIELPEVIDGLVYCPGSILLKPFKSISEEQFTEDFNLNFLGAVRSIKASVAGLKKSENNPGIVLFSTVAVSNGMPFHASIASSKGAVEGLTRSLAAEFAPTIRVNAIAPSLTHTDLTSKLLSTPEKMAGAALRHPLKKIGSAEDIADMAYFLLSNEAKWITGQIMHVDGGLSAINL